MLMKLTPAVNFINVECENFLYERWFWQLFSSYMYVVKAAKMTFVRKICTFNVDEINTCLPKMCLVSHIFTYFVSNFS